MMGNLNCCLLDEDKQDRREMDQYYATQRPRKSVGQEGSTMLYGPSHAYTAATSHPAADDARSRSRSRGISVPSEAPPLRPSHTHSRNDESSTAGGETAHAGRTRGASHQRQDRAVGADCAGRCSESETNVALMSMGTTAPSIVSMTSRVR